MRILHFSDPHAGGPAEDWLAYIDKRGVGCFNFRFRRRDIHKRELLRAFCTYAVQSKPDLVVCTGDLTSTSQLGEFDQSLSDMRALTDSSIPMLYIPGNHDYYVPREKCVSKMKETFAFLNRHFSLTFDHLPAAIAFGGVRFLLVNEAEPTTLVSSCGYLKKKDVKILCETIQKDEPPFILIGHYPVIERHYVRRFRHRLWGQDELVSRIRDGRIALSLHGHIHAPYWLESQAGRILECCAGSLTRMGSFTEITVEQNGGTAKIIPRMKKIDMTGTVSDYDNLFIDKDNQ